MLFCLEPGAHLPPLQLLCGASAAFDPQGDLHLAISGVPVDERPRASAKSRIEANRGGGEAEGA